MSWLDSIGEWAGNVTGYNDIVNDWNQAFSNDNNVFSQLAQFGAAVPNELMKQTYRVPMYGVAKVGEAAQAGAGIAGRAVTAPVALAHPEWGQQLGLNDQQYHDKVMGSIFDLDAQASPGQVAIAGGNSLLGGLFGGIAGQNAANESDLVRNQLGISVNPYDPAQRQKWFEGSTTSLTDTGSWNDAPWKAASGWTDLGFSTTLDPTNLAGPTFKVTKAATLGKKLVTAAPDGILARAGITATTPDRLAGMLEKGHTFDAFREFHRENQGNALAFHEHDFVKSADPSERMALSNILASTAPENLNDALRVAYRAGTDAEIEAAALRLKQSFTVKPGENSYLVDRIKDGVAERVWANENGSEILMDPDLLDKQSKLLTDFIDDTATPAGQAYRNIVDRMASDATPWVNQTPMRGLAGKGANAAASRRAGAIVGDTRTVTKDVLDDRFATPAVTTYQPTPQHPVVMIVDRTKNLVRRTGEFFHTLRPEGIINVNDGDSAVEFSAWLRQGDKFTGGRLSMLTDEQRLAGEVPESHMWANAYINADSEAARGAIATQLNQRIFQLQAARYGLTEDAARDLFAELKRNEDTVRAQLKQTKGMFTSHVINGEPVISHDPLLARENVDNIQWLWDPREVDRALRNHAPESWNQMLANKAGDTAQSAIDNLRLDSINDAFKMAALLRMGYLQRNLGEAYLSMAASGHAVGVAMQAFGESPQMARNWVNNRLGGSASLADRWATRVSKRRADLPSLRYQEQVADAYHKHLEYLSEWLIERLGNLHLADDASDLAVQQAARLRAEHSLSHHFHVTDGELPEVTGDFLATTDSHYKANRFMGDMYDYYSPYEDSMGSVEDLAAKVAELAGDDTSVLEYQLATGEWAPLSSATVNRWVRERTKDGVFRPRPDDMNLHVRARTRGKVPKIITVPAYGKHVDFSDGRKIPAGLDVNDRAALAAWARENGVGKITVKDPEWGKTTLLLRDTVDYKGGEGYKPIARRRAQEIVDGFGQKAQTVMPMAAGSAENRALRRQYKNAMRSTAKPVRAKLVGLPDPVFHDYTEQVLDAMMQKDIVGTMRELAEKRAQAKVDLEYARNARMARQSQVAGLGRKHVLGTGQGGAFSGDIGSVMFNRTSASNTNDRLVADGTRVADVVSTPVATVVQPGQTRYYEGWANMLNNKFRGTREVDPIVQQFLDGADPWAVEDWAKFTREGRNHMAKMGWSGDDIPDAIAKLHSATDLYIPAGPVRDAFRNGEPVTEDLLRQQADMTGHKPELRAELAPMSAEYADKVKYPGTVVSRGARKMLHYLGALPEDTFARHPLYRKVYTQQYRILTREGVARKGETLTVAEANRLQKRAAEIARQEVNRTLFTINRRPDAARSLRFISPFYAAWDNQVRRWAGFAIHHPDSMSQFASKVALAANNMHIVDGNGDPISLEKATDPNNIMDAAWITPLPNASGMGGNVKVSLSSLDIVMSGQPGPGLGPMAALPLYELMKDSPSLQDQYKWAFPAGVPDNEIELFLPAAARKLTQTNESTRSYASAANLIMQTELLRWQKGERDTAPTVDEVKEKARNFIYLKAATNLLAPFSVQYGSETDFYKTALRNLQDIHRNEPNGQQAADAEFLDKYPEAFDILPSLSRNNAKAFATGAAVDNMKRYKTLGASATVAEDPGLFGFVANYGLKYNKQDFSSAAYSWQFSNRGDMPDEYRQTLTPEEIHKQALVDKGWIEFSRVMDAVETSLGQQGIDPTSKVGVQVIAKVRQQFAQDHRDIANPDGTTEQNPWFLDYNSSDKAKYDRRAGFFNDVLNDKTFMRDHGNDPLIKNIGAYLSLRAMVGTALLQAKEQGGSLSLKAQQNAGIAAYWAQQVQALKAGNIEFAAWVDRYFTNDSVVL